MFSRFCQLNNARESAGVMMEVSRVLNDIFIMFVKQYNKQWRYRNC